MTKKEKSVESKKIRKHESLAMENEGMLISYLVIFWLHSTQNKMVRSYFFFLGMEVLKMQLSSASCVS